VQVSSNRLSIILISIGTALIVASLIMFAVWWQAYSDANGNSDLETIAGFGEPIKTPTAGPSPTAIANYPPASEAPLARLIIPAAEIDAPVVVKGVDAGGVMESPDNAFDTAWYDFSAKPGYGGNAVFSGHVDYINVGKAVFWNLKDLNPGDEIQVRLEDGTIYTYKVNFKQQYDAETAPVEQIVGPTPNETITLITCSGTFSSASHQYDKRLVVRAERVSEPPPSTSGAPNLLAAHATG
jgi:LPXTG-site transpeptidase (sortase) family protein